MNVLPLVLSLSTLLALPVTSEGQQVAVADGLRMTFAMPRVLAASVYMSRALVVEAVYQATALSGGGMVGQVVTTGTLAPGFGGAYQYAPQPADRLVVHYGGQVHEFVVQEAQGNPQAMTADAWILSPHRLRYRHRMGTEAESEITVRFDGSAFEVSIRGWTTQWGRRYELDLRTTGRQAGVQDFEGQDLQTTYDMTGSIRGQGLEIVVAEHHVTALASAMGLRLLPSQRGSASQGSATVNSVLSFDGVRYQFRDVRIQSGSSTRGGQSSGGMTSVEGAVLRDGQRWGQFVYRQGRALLEHPQGVIDMNEGPGR